MSSLRAFRFQKSKKANGSETDPDAEASQGGAGGAGPVSADAPTAFTADTDESQSLEMVVRKPAKRPRMISESEDESESGVSPAPLGPGPAGEEEGEEAVPGQVMPTSQIIEARLDQMQKQYPHMDRMALQDALKASDWNVLLAINRLRPLHKKEAKPKKSVVKSHEMVRDLGASDSEGENEYNDNKLVYESDSDDADSDRSITDDEDISEEKRRVLDFFGSANEQELACLQGCSKKKVLCIIKMRPIEGWTDLVRKIQASKQLNTELLNNASLLIKMRDAVARLMEKCEKITEKMENIVQDLTNGTSARMELHEQPKIISPNFTMTGYQMIGLNWLALMHKQALNGILADEMGLGKTIQAIGFLAHLKETGDKGPHLIIVPSSTMENWQKEMETWCPSLKVLNYYGSQDERRHMRLQIVNEETEFDVILTTYNMVISSPDDRVLFRKLEFHYVIFDEAHMLKNMATSRYENLMRVQASRKLLLTGTPLQNNLVELMSLLVFVMPEMFANKKEQLKKMFSIFPRNQEDNGRSKYEKDRIAHAKRIMKPFFLRRLKSEVLTELPKKTEEVIRVPMLPRQQEIYFNLVSDYKERAKAVAEGRAVAGSENSGVGLLMNLRKAANHPLLIRSHYDDTQVKLLAKILKKQDSGHKEAVEAFIREDLSVLTDFLIHKTCLEFRSIENHSLGNHFICESGKFSMLDKLLPDMKERDDRVLIFTQFTMVLDIMEQYLRIRGHKYLRLDGSTPVQERQVMIDKYNQDDSIFIFILSTKAGGLGINLTSANTVILHDLDFNPYNDKQAEDRCHRVGQTRPVRVIRFLSVDTIEEGIHSIAQEKLRLEQDLTNSGSEDATTKKTVKKDLSRLLKIALDVEMSEKQMGDVGKVYTDL
ncbi:SWI/SNF-related matrix-associated actin-dependent regulator of chromatin subfamily A containing DEAD/H box 1 homolog [Tigriopus californicus]|uniref:SWI/SNF-related matrix-associated actin-dependent regulator of chromatin subfamily A containing DEAD/H box 1 homolog n=1 Tax=Tigriopus californicus TaxID=6832 RepID=UPI0027DA36B0|nr:SWI/SNF-related matrix-associated actin-dependent regulator of chromatin subfamily A containing DEAD/H box 1 homolog [Tigriopus californicus]